MEWIDVAILALKIFGGIAAFAICVWAVVFFVFIKRMDRM